MFCRSTWMPEATNFCFRATGKSYFLIGAISSSAAHPGFSCLGASYILLNINSHFEASTFEFQSYLYGISWKRATIAFVGIIYLSCHFQSFVKLKQLEKCSCKCMFVQYGLNNQSKFHRLTLLAAILVSHGGTPIWQLHTGLCKFFCRNISTNIN